MVLYTTGTDDEKLIGTYCGTDIEPGDVIQSTGPDMFVLFISDSLFNTTGFLATFEFVNGKSIRFNHKLKGSQLAKFTK